MWPGLLFGACASPLSHSKKWNLLSHSRTKPPGYSKTGCIIKLAFQNKRFLCCNNSLREFCKEIGFSSLCESFSWYQAILLNKD